MAISHWEPGERCSGKLFRDDKLVVELAIWKETGFPFQLKSLGTFI